MRRVNPDYHFLAEFKDSKLRDFKLHVHTILASENLTIERSHSAMTCIKTAYNSSEDNFQ